MLPFQKLQNWKISDVCLVTGSYSARSDNLTMPSRSSSRVYHQISTHTWPRTEVPRILY